MGKRLARLVGVVMLVGCNGAPATPPPAPLARAPVSSSAPAATPSAPDSIGALPDTKAIAALSARARESTSCSDTCCLPKLDWLGTAGPPLSDEGRRAVRAALDSLSAPADLAVALRVLSHGADADDTKLVAKYVEDTRVTTRLPDVFSRQAFHECESVTWQDASPSSEALAILGRIHATTFHSPASYRAWASRTPDPERSFEVWNARLSQREPPEKPLVDRLRATDLDLFLYVMLYRCRGDERCGTSDADLAHLLATRAGPERARRWLDGTEDFPPLPSGASTGELRFNVVRLGEKVFRPADVASLEATWRAGKLGRTTLHAMLGVLLAKTAPARAASFFRDLLVRGMAELPRDGLAYALHEAARLDPKGTQADLARWIHRPGDDDDLDAAIFDGLANGGDRAAPVLGRLLDVPPPPPSASRSDTRSAIALHRAGARFGCPGIGNVDDLAARPLKGEREEAFEPRRARAAAARVALFGAMKRCAVALRAK